jgi:hypothetical protein
MGRYGQANHLPQDQLRANRPKEKLVSHDVIVDEVPGIRDALVKRYGGLNDWIQHLQAVDRERVHQSHRRTRRKCVAQVGARKPRRAS